MPVCRAQQRRQSGPRRLHVLRSGYCSHRTRTTRRQKSHLIQLRRRTPHRRLSFWMRSSKSVNAVVTEHGMGIDDAQGTLTICMTSELEILTKVEYEYGVVRVRESTKFGSGHTEVSSSSQLAFETSKPSAHFASLMILSLCIFFIHATHPRLTKRHL